MCGFIKKVLQGGLISMICLMPAYAAQWSYPEKTGYADVPTIDVAELYQSLQNGNGWVVDVRSEIEFETAHIKDAMHISVSSRDFISNLQAEVAKKPQMNIYFYCNGPTCLKSPLAAKTAIQAGVKNSFAFYPGLPGWADAHPEATVLRGQPISSSNQMISDEAFHQKNLSYEDFVAAIANDDNAVVIDIRDNIQRTAELPGIQKNVLTISMDKLIPNFIRQHKEQNKTLYVFDQVGKQVQALQYELNDNGYQNYWFLKKGVTKVLGEQKYKK
ncbi:MAG: hypothetical protein HQM07_06735 [Zetaproteobacteria bacterium]|nr:hypothetical protein [Zetaproteobacteria bacterium]